MRQAVILAGGRGTRLGMLSATCPKPLLPVAGRPFLHWLIRWLAMAGVDDIILATGHLAEGFADFIAQGQRKADWRGPEGEVIRIRESREAQPCGTAGALKLLDGQLDPHFFLLNGDSYFDCDLIALSQQARQLAPDQALMALREVEDAARFGRVECGTDQRITRFAEKTRAGPGLINAGISILPAAITRMITTLPCLLEQEIYPQLVAEARLYGQQQSGYFIDIGLPESLSAAQLTLHQALRRPAVFFDRDGVLNRDTGYTYRTQDLQLMPGAAKAVALARQAGFRCIVVTNQAGIGRGYYSETEMRDFHHALNQALWLEGGWIDGFYHCPFHPEAELAAYRHDNHPERKPNPGMILRASRELQLETKQSLLIGDRDSDLAAAAALGMPALHFQTGRLDTLLLQHLQDRPLAPRPEAHFHE